MEINIIQEWRFQVSGVQNIVQRVSSEPTSARVKTMWTIKRDLFESFGLSKIKKDYLFETFEIGLFSALICGSKVIPRIIELIWILNFKCIPVLKNESN